MGRCAFCYMLNLFGVMVLYRDLWLIGGGHLPWVDVHTTICETYWV